MENITDLLFSDTILPEIAPSRATAASLCVCGGQIQRIISGCTRPAVQGREVQQWASLGSLFVCFIKNGHQPGIDFCLRHFLHNISSLSEILKIQPSMERIQFSLDCIACSGHPSIYSYSTTKMPSIEPHICLTMFLIYIFLFLNA